MAVVISEYLRVKSNNNTLIFSKYFFSTGLTDLTISDRLSYDCIFKIYPLEGYFHNLSHMATENIFISLILSFCLLRTIGLIGNKRFGPKNVKIR